jgi:hypothetical protein
MGHEWYQSPVFLSCFDAYIFILLKETPSFKVDKNRFQQVKTRKISFVEAMWHLPQIPGMGALFLIISSIPVS